MLIATRTLKIRQSAEDIDVPVRVFAPENEETRGWGCRFEIAWPDRTAEMTARGGDAVQALEIALKLIGAQLYASAYHQDGSLVFRMPGAGNGFPVPANMRDLLVGDDAKVM